MINNYLRDIRNATVGVSELVLAHYLNGVTNEISKMSVNMVVDGDSLEKIVGRLFMVPMAIFAMATVASAFTGAVNVGKCMYYPAREVIREAKK